MGLQRRRLLKLRNFITLIFLLQDSSLALATGKNKKNDHSSPKNFHVREYKQIKRDYASQIGNPHYVTNHIRREQKYKNITTMGYHSPEHYQKTRKLTRQHLKKKKEGLKVVEKEVGKKTVLLRFLDHQPEIKIFKVPNEIWVIIFSFLKAIDLSIVSLVSKSWHLAANDAFVLRHVWPVKFCLREYLQDDKFVDNFLNLPIAEDHERVEILRKFLTSVKKRFEDNVPIESDLLAVSLTPWIEKEGEFNLKYSRDFMNRFEEKIQMVSQQLRSLIMNNHLKAKVRQEAYKLLANWYLWAYSNNWLRALRIGQDFLAIVNTITIETSFRHFAFQKMGQWYLQAYLDRDKYAVAVRSSDGEVKGEAWEIANIYWKILTHKTFDMPLQLQALDKIKEWHQRYDKNQKNSSTDIIIKEYLSVLTQVKLEKNLRNKIYDLIETCEDSCHAPMVINEYLNIISKETTRKRIRKQICDALARQYVTYHLNQQGHSLNYTLEDLMKNHIEKHVSIKLQHYFLKSTQRWYLIIQQKFLDSFSFIIRDYFQLIFCENLNLNNRYDALKSLKALYDLKYHLPHHPAVTFDFYKKALKVIKNGIRQAYRNGRYQAIEAAKNYGFLLQQELSYPWLSQWFFAEMDDWYRWAYGKGEISAGQIAQIYNDLLTTKASQLWADWKNLERINDWYDRAVQDKEMSTSNVAAIYFHNLTTKNLEQLGQEYFYEKMVAWYLKSYQKDLNHGGTIRKSLRKIITHKTLHDDACKIRTKALKHLHKLYKHTYKANKITAISITEELLTILKNYKRQEDLLEEELGDKIEYWHILARHEKNYNGRYFSSLCMKIYNDFPHSSVRQQLCTLISPEEETKGVGLLRKPKICPKDILPIMVEFERHSPNFLEERATWFEGSNRISCIPRPVEMRMLWPESIGKEDQNIKKQYEVLNYPNMFERMSSDTKIPNAIPPKNAQDPFNFRTPSPTPPTLRSSQEDIQKRSQYKHLKNTWQRFKKQDKEMSGEKLKQLAGSLLQLSLEREKCSLKQRHKALKLFVNVFNELNKRSDIQPIEREKLATLCLKIASVDDINIYYRKHALSYALTEVEKGGIVELYKLQLSDQENLLQITQQAYIMGKSFLQIVRTLDLSFSEANRVLHQANQWLGFAVKGRGGVADTALQLKKQLSWGSSIGGMENPEQRKSLKNWLRYIHEPSAYYKLGLIYLDVDSKRAQKYFIKGTYLNRQSPYRTACAYYLGYLYALRYISGSFPEMDMRYWLCKANRWQSRQNQEIYAIKCINEWQQRALGIDSEAAKYAFVLNKLVEVCKSYNAPLSQKDLPNFVANPAIQEKAISYANIHQERITSGPSLYQPCTCVVIGGGLSGIVSAIQLAKLKTSEGQPLFKVILREHNAHCMEETSAVPARLHLGGEYPLDGVTGKDCLHTSLLFYQMIPHGYTNIPAVTYLLDRQTHYKSEQNNGKGQLSLKKMIDQYKILREYYHEYYSILKNDEQFKNRHIFGAPEDLFRPLTKEEMKLVKGFVGGIVTHEPGLNPAILGAYLEEQLHQVGVEVKVNDPVIAAKQKPYGYKLYGREGKKDKAHLVVNAAWGHAIELDHDIISPEEKLIYPNELKVFLRGMAVVDISKCQIPCVGTPLSQEKEKCKEKETELDESQRHEKTALFGMLGEHGGMFSPFNDKIAWCYWPSKKGSYLTWGKEKQEFFTITGNRIIDQQNWNNLENYIQKEFSKPKQREHRAQAILNNLIKKYPSLKGAKAKDLIIRRLLSPEKKTKRPHSMVRCWGKDGGWLQAISLKASFVASTSLEVTRYALEYLKTLGIDERYWALEVFQGKEWLDKMHHWMEDWQLPPNNVPIGINLPPLFRLSPLNNEDDLVQKAQAWAKARGLPPELAIQ